MDLPHSPRQVARDFARDCARLMNVESVDRLDRAERRQMALRWAWRTQLPALRDATRDERPWVRGIRDDIAAEIVADRWPDYFPPLPNVIAALGRTHADLRQHVLPRLEAESGFLVFGDNVTTETAVVARHGYAERVSESGAVSHASPFEITVSKEIPKVEQPVFTHEQRENGRILKHRAGRRLSPRQVYRNRQRIMKDALYSQHTVLAVRGAIETLSQFPWSRCANEICLRVFAPGRKGALYCSRRCRGRAAYDERRAELAADPRKRLTARRKQAAAVKRLSDAKKNGTWERRRRPGAGRPPKRQEE